MSETMSSPTDWTQFYQQNIISAGQEVSNRGRVVSSDSSMFGDQGSEASTVVTIPIASTGAAPSPLGSGPITSSGGHLSPEGRVGKPVRRRSRASRRTPTTLLNTDTTNFRAMVQQFTGGPSAPFSAGGHPGGQNFGFAFGGRQIPHVNPAGSLTVPPAGFHIQYQQQQQQQTRQLIQHQNQAYMFPLNINNNNNPGGAGGELFLERVGGNNARANMEGFVVEGGISSDQVAAASRSSAAAAASSNENRSNATTFMF